MNCRQWVSQEMKKLGIDAHGFQSRAGLSVEDVCSNLDNLDNVRRISVALNMPIEVVLNRIGVIAIDETLWTRVKIINNCLHLTEGDQEGQERILKQVNKAVIIASCNILSKDDIQDLIDLSEHMLDKRRKQWR